MVTLSRLLRVIVVASLIGWFLPATAAEAGLSVGEERAIASVRPDAAQREPDVAWNGSVYYVVWYERVVGGLSQVYGARVRPDGTVLDPGGVRLSDEPFNNHLRPRVASGAGKFLVVWEIDVIGTHGELGAALVRGNGTVQKRWWFGGDNHQYRPDVAWNGRLFLVAWQDEVEQPWEIYGTRILPDGLTLDGCSTDSCPGGDWVGLPLATEVESQVRPALTASSVFFLLTFTDDSSGTPTVRHSAVALTGTPMLRQGWPVTPDTQGTASQDESAATWNRDTAMYAWTQTAPDGNNVIGALHQPGTESSYRVHTSPPGGFVISGATGTQSQPALARRGSGFLAAWTDTRSGNTDVFAARVSATGNVLDPGGVGMATGVRAQQRPSVAGGRGTAVLLAYEREAPTSSSPTRTRVFLRLIS